MLGTFLSSISAYSLETIEFAIGDWPPYTSPTDPKSKIAEKIVTEAFKIEGINVKYVYYPWKRSYENSKSGIEIGTFPWNVTPERKKEFYINKETIITDEGVYFHLKSKEFD